MNKSIYLFTPINSLASRVTSQANCSYEDLGVKPYELNQQAEKTLSNKRKIIGDFLGLATKKKRKNTMYLINSRPNYIRNHKNSAALQEWYDIGKEAARIKQYLHIIKKGS